MTASAGGGASQSNRMMLSTPSAWGPHTWQAAGHEGAHQLHSRAFSLVGRRADLAEPCHGAAAAQTAAHWYPSRPVCRHVHPCFALSAYTHPPPRPHIPTHSPPAAPAHLEAQQHVAQVAALHLRHAGRRQQLLEVLLSTQPEGVARAHPPCTPCTLLRRRLGRAGGHTGEEYGSGAMMQLSHVGPM